MCLSKALKDAQTKEQGNLHICGARFESSCWSKKSIILTPCTFTQRKRENEQRKSYRILISSCWTTDIRLFDFYRKRRLGPDQSHYNQSRLWSSLQTTLAQITQITPKWIYIVLNIFTPFTIFEQLALAMKKQSCPVTFHCVEYTFYIQNFEQLALALKNRVALQVFTVLNMCFLSFRIFEQLALALKKKQSCPEIFHCIEYTFWI